MNQEEKTEKVVKMHTFLVCAYNSKDLAQTKENFARLHDHETVTFRNSVWEGNPRLEYLKANREAAWYTERRKKETGGSQETWEGAEDNMPNPSQPGDEFFSIAALGEKFQSSPMD